MTYQSRVAAWTMSRMLAGLLGPALGEPAGLSIEAVRCETEQPVDDQLVVFSNGSRAFIQVKHGLRAAGVDPTSAYSSVIRQFVRQVRVQGAAPGPTASRSFDFDRDLLVLVVDPSATRRIQNDLRQFLEKGPATSQGVPLPTEVERTLVADLTQVITREWTEAAGIGPTTAEVTGLLGAMRIRVLDLDPNGTDERAARDLLQGTVLADPSTVTAAWSHLVDYAAQAVKQHGGVDRVTVENHLSALQVALRPSLLYRQDIERLVAYSQAVVARLARHESIRFLQQEIHLDREVLPHLRDGAEAGSTVVVGEPGAGKSAVLHALATALVRDGRDVVLLAADVLERGELRASVGTTNDIDTILRNWPGTKPGFLIVDALDAARSEVAASQLRDLIDRVHTAAPRWRVVASIRKYDLRYSTQLARLFAGTPGLEFSDPEFSRTRHVAVRRLSSTELAQLERAAPELARATRAAPPALVGLLGNVFNLRLLAELIATGVGVDTLHAVKTQADLLARYWDARVLDAVGAMRDARELALTRAVHIMIKQRTLRANRRDVADPSGALSDLLGAQVLIEWQRSDEAKPERSILTFAHHIVFDYAVDCLHLRPDPGPLALIERDPSLVIAIRPSLILHFQYLWGVDPHHSAFWALALGFAASTKAPEVAKILGPVVVAECASSIDDCGKLFSAGPMKDAAENLFQHVVGAILAAPPDAARPLIGFHAPPWSELAARLAACGTRRATGAASTLLRALCANPELLTVEQRGAAGQAARSVLAFVGRDENYNPFWIREAIESVVKTFASAPPESARSLRVFLNPNRPPERLQAELPAIAHEAEPLVSATLSSFAISTYLRSRCRTTLSNRYP